MPNLVTPIKQRLIIAAICLCYVLMAIVNNGAFSHTHEIFQLGDKPCKQ